MNAEFYNTVIERVRAVLTEQTRRKVEIEVSVGALDGNTGVAYADGLSTHLGQNLPADWQLSYAQYRVRTKNGAGFIHMRFVHPNVANIELDMREFFE